MISLSILICTIPERQDSFYRLINALLTQKTEAVEILSDSSKDISIGSKRNTLLSLAKGEYVCFIDDDDMVSDDYISQLLNAIELDPDNVSLLGIMTTNGSNPEVFEHSITYEEYKTTDNYIKYERYPNHLNCIKASIAKQFKFPEINHGEDTDWATQLHNSGLLKKEVFISTVLYYYQYKTKK